MNFKSREYNIRTMFIDPDDKYSDREALFDEVMDDNHPLIAFKAPRRFGKTTFCAYAARNSQYRNILFYTKFKADRKNFVNKLLDCFDVYQSNGISTRLIGDDNVINCICGDRSAIEEYFFEDFDMVIIDDADIVEPWVISAAINNIPHVYLVGSDEVMSTIKLQKSTWDMAFNSPAFHSYQVLPSDKIKREDIDDGAIISFANLFTKPIFAY